jgi:hypothetical protein
MEGITMESKDFAKDIRKFIKQTFPGLQFRVLTQDQKIFIRWDDILFNEFVEPVENFMNEYNSNNYVNVKEIEFWRETTNEYKKNNPNWSREHGLKTIHWTNKIENPITENKMVAEIANVIYKNKKVNVILSNNNESNTITFDYKKSWSHKKYIEKAMQQTGIEAGFNFRYGWDMTAL